MSNIIEFDLDNILENADSTDSTAKTDSDSTAKTESSKRPKRPVFELPVYAVETNKLFNRIAKKPNRDAMNKLREKYKSEPLTVCNDCTIQRSEIRNDRKLIAKSFRITLKSNDDEIKTLPSIEFNYSLKREKRPDDFDSTVESHFLSADSMPHRLALTCFVLRVLKPYHSLKYIECTTKKCLDPNALIVSYKSTAFDLVFNACLYVFKHVPTALLCTYTLLNALFDTDIKIDEKMPQISLKTLKSLL